jgi:hypothetical protein
MGGQHHAQAALPPEMTRNQLYRRMDGPQGPKSVEYLNYLGITNVATCTREIKSRTDMAKASFDKKMLFTWKLGLSL